jgi:hypothetical protein
LGEGEGEEGGEEEEGSLHVDEFGRYLKGFCAEASTKEGVCFCVVVNFIELPEEKINLQKRGRRKKPTLAMTPFGKSKGLFQRQEKERSSSLFIPLVLFKNRKLITIRNNLLTRVPRQRICER